MEERAWFEQVYRQNVDLLFRVGRRLLDSDENPDTLYDMVQEIFLLLWDRRRARAGDAPRAQTRIFAG